MFGPTCYKAVKKTLIKEWEVDGQPNNINKIDLKAGMKLLANMGVANIISATFADKGEPVTKDLKNNSLGIISENDLIAKIEDFAKTNAFRFKKVCQTGIPFFRLKESEMQIALQSALADRNSILSHLMISSDDVWLGAEELDARFGGALPYLTTKAIAKTCLELTNSYLRKGDNRSGYYLLWLVKRACGCSYEMPAKDSFDKSSVSFVLSQFYASGNGQLTDVVNFIEILHSRSYGNGKCIYENFFNPAILGKFFAFTIEMIATVSMNEWPSKTNIIMTLLKRMTTEGKIAVAEMLMASEDTESAEIGKHFAAAFAAPSLKEAVPHYKALEASMRLSSLDVDILFNRPYQKLCVDKVFFENDPDFVRRVSFNERNKVFVHDNALMIGSYKGQAVRSGKAIPGHLLAYRMDTEELVWGIPLISKFSGRSSSSGIIDYVGKQVSKHYLGRAGIYLTLQFYGENAVHFIHPETGEIRWTVETPKVASEAFDQLHFSGDEGLAYQKICSGNKLYVGELINGKWNSLYETQGPGGPIVPLSTHCGFFKEFEKKLFLYGSVETPVIIENCLAVQAKGDKLYLIERDPASNDKCVLTVRTLKTDEEVVSSVEKSISLNTKAASFGDLCNTGGRVNNLWVLLSNNYNLSPIFVDLTSDEVVYSDFSFSPTSAYVINASSGELWSWEVVTGKVFKVSSTKVSEKGVLKSGRGTLLLHIGKNDELFFANHPF